MQLGDGHSAEQWDPRSELGTVLRHSVVLSWRLTGRQCASGVVLERAVLMMSHQLGSGDPLVMLRCSRPLLFGYGVGSHQPAN